MRVRDYLGADEGNRTPVSALARLCSTIELHLHLTGDILPYLFAFGKHFFIFFKMAVQMGLEPTISSVTGRHVNHYTTGPSTALNKNGGVGEI